MPPWRTLAFAVLVVGCIWVLLGWAAIAGLIFRNRLGLTITMPVPRINMSPYSGAALLRTTHLCTYGYFRRLGQASGRASILWKIDRNELLAGAMKICLYPLVRLISGKTDQTITREDEGLAEASWRQDCTP